MKAFMFRIVLALAMAWASCGFLAYGVSRAGSCVDLRIDVVKYPAYYLENPANLQTAWRWRDKLGRFTAALGPMGLLVSVPDIGDGFLLGDCDCSNELNTAYWIQEGKKEASDGRRR